MSAESCNPCLDHVDTPRATHYTATQGSTEKACLLQTEVEAPSKFLVGFVFVFLNSICLFFVSLYMDNFEVSTLLING